MQLSLQHRVDRRIHLGNAAREHRQRRLGDLGNGLTHIVKPFESLATREGVAAPPHTWSPGRPSEPRARPRHRSGAGRTPTTLASLCSRESCADATSCASAARTLGLRLAAIEMPMPLPQTRTPRSTRPEAMASAHGHAKIGIVDGLGRMGSQIQHVVTRFLQVTFQNLLEVEAGMIRRDRDGAPPASRRSSPSNCRGWGYHIRGRDVTVPQNRGNGPTRR